MKQVVAAGLRRERRARRGRCGAASGQRARRGVQHAADGEVLEARAQVVGCADGAEAVRGDGVHARLGGEDLAHARPAGEVRAGRVAAHHQREAHVVRVLRRKRGHHTAGDGGAPVVHGLQRGLEAPVAARLEHEVDSHGAHAVKGAAAVHARRHEGPAAAGDLAAQRYRRTHADVLPHGIANQTERHEVPRPRHRTLRHDLNERSTVALREIGRSGNGIPTSGVLCWSRMPVVADLEGPGLVGEVLRLVAEDAPDAFVVFRIGVVRGEGDARVREGKRLRLGPRLRQVYAPLCALERVERRDGVHAIRFDLEEDLTLADSDVREPLEHVPLAAAAFRARGVIEAEAGAPHAQRGLRAAVASISRMFIRVLAAGRTADAAHVETVCVKDKLEGGNLRCGVVPPE
mmetsp:Transcript_5600/g.22110  ORF Transcript_5600/g.22110 Transcript_5600/m.22110 type:complete len:404 (+) Transcript_5600:3251-4462(+)